METNGSLENFVEIKNQKIELEGVTLLHMNEIRKWTQFMSILGFVVVGLLLLVGVIFLIASFTRPSMQIDEFGISLGPWMGICYLLLALVYFFPVFKVCQTITLADQFSTIF
jgi:membrane-bound ClpP family serine protease